MELAYLDPGAGSVIITAVVGGVASIGVAIRAFKMRVASTFSRGGAADSDDGSAAAPAGDVSSGAQPDDEEPDQGQPAKVDNQS